MTRTNARELAVHFVFAHAYSEEQSEQEMMDIRLQEEYYPLLAGETELYSERPGKKEEEYIRNLVSGVCEKKQELDSYIEKYAVGWKVSRISKIALAILEVAIYEILYVSDVPAGVAINEAVELTKKYEEDSVSSFVNGILGSVAKEVANDVSGN